MVFKNLLQILWHSFVLLLCCKHRAGSMLLFFIPPLISQSTSIQLHEHACKMSLSVSVSHIFVHDGQCIQKFYIYSTDNWSFCW